MFIHSRKTALCLGVLFVFALLLVAGCGGKTNGTGSENRRPGDFQAGEAGHDDRTRCGRRFDRFAGPRGGKGLEQILSAAFAGP